MSPGAILILAIGVILAIVGVAIILIDLFDYGGVSTYNVILGIVLIAVGIFLVLLQQYKIP